MKQAGVIARKATIEDVPHILRMSYDFYKECICGPEEDYDPKTVASQAAAIISSKDAVMFVVENGKGPVGMVTLFENPAYYNVNKRVIVDHHFWLHPDYREGSAVKVLLNAAKNWAQNRKKLWLRGRIHMGKTLKFKRVTDG